MVDLTLFASLNVQTISLLEANIIVNLLLGTDKIMLQRYMIVLATIQVLCSFCPKNVKNMLRLLRFMQFLAIFTSKI